MQLTQVSVNGQATPMPSRATQKPHKRPWQARATRHGIFHHLGMFATYEEALEAELAFAEQYPPAKKRIVRRDPTAPITRTPYQARRYRNGQYIHLGSFATEKEARAVEAAFDAANPRKKPGPNPSPDRPMTMRKRRYAY